MLGGGKTPHKTLSDLEHLLLGSVAPINAWATHIQNLRSPCQAHPLCSPMDQHMTIDASLPDCTN